MYLYKFCQNRVFSNIYDLRFHEYISDRLQLYPQLLSNSRNSYRCRGIQLTVGSGQKKNPLHDGSEHQKAVMPDCHDCKFACERQKSTPCMTIRGLQRLLMILGVKVAAKYSKIAECALNSFSVAQVFAP